MPRSRKTIEPPERWSIPAPTPAGLLDIDGAAKWLGVGRSTLFVLMQESGFPIIRLTERTVRFDPNSLYAWALAHQSRIG